MPLAAALAPVTSRPGSAVVVFDFDGTLSDIVPDPAAATPRPGVIDHLHHLTSRYRRVGVISGRPASFLARTIPDGVYLSGLYGMEELVDGEVVAPEQFRRWASVVTAAVADLRAAVDHDGTLSGVEVEDKGLSVTVHYRSHPEIGIAVRRMADGVASDHGLDVRPARMSVEIHPPVPTDKGAVLRALVERHAPVEAVLFVGDDVGDLPAFEALADLRASGMQTLAVAVSSSEMDPRVRAIADVVVAADQVDELLRVLGSGGGADA